jgi:hypothetical protein
MSDDSYEPYVILDRSEIAALAPSPRRWTVLRGRKPALLLIDRGGSDGAGLDLPLASEGFDVYRTTGRESALDLLEAHPSVLMALVRMDLPTLDPVSLIRDLSVVRPGLWTGMLCDPAERTRAAEGYAAGVVDLFHPLAPPPATVARLIRSVPWALRRREEAERRLERRRERESGSGLRRAARQVASRLGLAAALTFALSLGIVLALATRSWYESRDAWNARVDRMLNALETPPAASDRTERQFDRWQRFEQLQLQRQSQQMQSRTAQEQLEQERLRELLRSAAPRYPAR